MRRIDAMLQCKCVWSGAVYCVTSETLSETVCGEDTAPSSAYCEAHTQAQWLDASTAARLKRAAERVWAKPLSRRFLPR